jgi:hypothetical protein
VIGPCRTTGRMTADREHAITVGEEFPFSGQVRPSAAAAGRRAGPVLAPLRAAGPAAAQDKGPMIENALRQAETRGLPPLRPAGPRRTALRTQAVPAAGGGTGFAGSNRPVGRSDARRSRCTAWRCGAAWRGAALWLAAPSGWQHAADVAASRLLFHPQPAQTTPTRPTGSPHSLRRCTKPRRAADQSLAGHPADRVRRRCGTTETESETEALNVPINVRHM